jgi:formamidopyrimidine-DNA glycosylase
MTSNVRVGDRALVAVLPRLCHEKVRKGKKGIMPELPEVETVRRSLEPFLVGQTVLQVEVREPRLRQTLVPEFARTLTGRTIRAIDRRGKYLHFQLDDRKIWLVHLGMTGQLVVETREALPLPHDHVRVALSSGQNLRYNDPRRFGLMIIGTVEEIDAVTMLGCEPLGRNFTTSYLLEKAAGTKRTIKDVLMDQRVVAGVGNIYASELLFRAGVQPGRIATTLDKESIERVVKATKEVLREAIRHRGSSISDYRDGEGKEGGFQQRFRVYDRDGEPCRTCRTVICRETRSGRSSFFCPSCQH